MTSVGILVLGILFFAVWHLSTSLERRFVVMVCAYYLTLLLLFFVSISFEGVSPFTSGDASFFNVGGIAVNDSLAGGHSLYDSLFNFTWGKKYWSYILVNSFAVSIFPDSILLQYLYVMLFNCCLWLVIIFHAGKNGLIESRLSNFKSYNLLLIIFLLAASVFPVFHNYRDSMIAIILYFLTFYLVLRPFMVAVIPLLILLYFTRGELIPIVFVGYACAMAASLFLKSKSGLALVLFFIVSIVGVYLIGHDRFSVNQIVKIPLGFMGTSPFQILALYADGLSYYQGRIFSQSAFFFFSSAWILFAYWFIKPIVVSFKLNDRQIKVYYFLCFVFIFNMVAYTLINDGFQERVRVAFVPFAIFFCYMFRDIKFSNTSFSIIVALFFIVAIRNVRWLI